MKKVENFCKALDNLKEIYEHEEPYENVVLTGLVAYYSICFEQAWQQALVSRNNVAHSYNESVALDIVRKTKDCYYELLCKLKNEIEENWN